MDKPTLVFSKTLLLFSTLLIGAATTCYAQFEESIVDSSLASGYSRSGSYFNRQLGSALRFNYQTEGYGTQKGIVTLGSMKVFNMDGATFNLDAQATLSDDFGAGYNAGLFYRSLKDIGFGPDSQRIMGIGFWSDGQSTSADNFFNQLGVTLESLGDSYDLRFQGNFPLERRQDGDPYEVIGADPVYEENFLMSEVFEFKRDTSLTNIDFEAAKRLMNLEAWAFLGGYHLSGGEYDATGYRAGVRGYAVPDLALTVQVTDDDIYHTNVMFGITWFVGRTSVANQPCGNVLDRFREPVLRNPYIATVQRTITDATTPYTDAVTGEEFFFVHVDDDTPAGTGDGTFENPYTTVNEAQDPNNSGPDNIILVHAETTNNDVQFVGQSGQRILGEGLDPNGNRIDHIINTAEDGLVVLPETDPNAKNRMAPIINGVVGNGNPDPNLGNIIFDLADDNELNNFQINANGAGSDVAVNATDVNAPQLANLDINGPFDFGVVFTEVTGSALIENSVTIDGTTDTGIWVNGGSSNVGANATITNSTGRSVVAENRQGGTLNFGEINDTGEGILAQNNDAGSITFSSLVNVGDPNSVTTDTAVTLLNNNGASITFQELQATSSNGDTFVVNGGGNITVNDTQGDGSRLVNTGDGSVLVARGDGFDPNTVDPTKFAALADPNNIDASPTINIAGDLYNNGDGFVTDVQFFDSGGVTVTGDPNDTSGVGMGMLFEENSGGIFSFTGRTELDTGNNTALRMRNNEGATIGFTQLRATANDADTVQIIGGGQIAITDPNNAGLIENTGSGTSLFVLGSDDPNGNAVGDPNVVINTDISNTGTGFAVDIQRMGGGSVDINGDVTDPNGGGIGMGVRAWNNNANISFDGLTNLDTGTNTAVSLRNNSGSNISFNNLMARATTADTFEVWGGGNINVFDDPNNPGFVNPGFITNTGIGSAVVVRGASEVGATGNPVLTIDTDVNNSGGGFAVDVEGMTGGTVDVNGDVTDMDTSGMGIRVWETADAAISFDSDTNLNTGGNTAVSLRNNTDSAITFANLNATADGGDTFVVEGGGTINVADPNGTATIENTGAGSALVMRGTSDPNSVGNADLTILADINNGGTGNVVDVQDMTAGSLIVTGDVNDPNGAGSGVHFEDNSGGTFSFAGNTTLDTGANSALTMVDNEGSMTTFTNLNATAAGDNTIDIRGGGRITLTDPNNNALIENTGAGAALFVRGNVNGDPNLSIDQDIMNSGSGHSVDIRDMDDNVVVLNGTINDTGDGVLVQDNSGDAVIQFSNTVTVNTSTGNAVELTNNAGANISFNGLDLTVTGGGKGFTATGGGNLTVLETNGTTIEQNGDGTALELDGITINDADVEFDVVNVTNGTDPNNDAVVLKDLAGTGTVVVGNGTNPGDGGQISTVGKAFNVSNANNVAVNLITINDPNGTDDAIFVTNQQAGSSANFFGIDITKEGGTGINVRGNTDGTIGFTDVTVDTTTGDAVFHQSNGDMTINYTELTATANAGDTFTINGGGTVNVDDTGNGSTITNTGTGTALVITGSAGPGTGNPTVSIAGSIDNDPNGGRSVNINNLRNGSVVDISADITDDSEGILIEQNQDAPITFGGMVTLNTGTDDALTIQANNAANTVSFNNSSVLAITTTGSGRAVVINNPGVVSILGTGNTINTDSGIGVDIDNTTSVTIANTTIDTDSANGVNINHGVAADMSVTLDNVTITNPGATAVDIAANSSGELDIVMDTINIATEDPNAHGIVLDTGANANRVDLSILGASNVAVGDARAFRATLDQSDTADVRMLVQGTEQQFENDSATKTAFDVLVDSNMTVSATIGDGPITTDPNDPTNLDPPTLPIGDVNRFRNQAAGAAFVFNNNAAGEVNLDLRDNTATSAGGAEFDLISGAGGTFNLVDRDETLLENTNDGTVTNSGAFVDILPPVLQPTP